MVNTIWTIRVAGVNSSISRSVLYRYFGAFGAIKKIEFIQSTNSIRMICRMLIDDHLTYMRILVAKNHTLLGRTLTCLPFLEGRALQTFNYSQNKCRVVLKRVPTFITEGMLVGCLENQVGRVAYIHRYKSESEYHKLSNRKYSCFLVSFSSPKSTTKMLSSEQQTTFYLKMYETTVNCYRFKTSYNEKKSNNKHPTVQKANINQAANGDPLHSRQLLGTASVHQARANDDLCNPVVFEPDSQVCIHRFKPTSIRYCMRSDFYCSETLMRFNKSGRY